MLSGCGFRKGEVMGRKLLVSFLALLLAIAVAAVGLAENEVFEPVKAPSLGPEGAPVTIYEIADFM